MSTTDDSWYRDVTGFAQDTHWLNGIMSLLTVLLVVVLALLVVFAGWRAWRKSEHVQLAAGLWLIDRRLGAIGTALALVEGFSRVYLGQHYPHDVHAALVLSSLIIFDGWSVVRGRIKPRSSQPANGNDAIPDAVRSAR